MFLVDFVGFFLDGELILYVLDADCQFLFGGGLVEWLCGVLFGVLSEAHRRSHFVLGSSSVLLLSGKGVTLLVFCDDRLDAIFVLFDLEPIREDLSVGIGFSRVAACRLEIELYESEQKFIVSFGNLQFSRLEKLLAFCSQPAHSLFEQLYCHGE